MFLKDAALVCECCRKRVEVSALVMMCGFARPFVCIWRHVRSLVCGQHLKHVYHVDGEPMDNGTRTFYNMAVRKARFLKVLLHASRQEGVS